MVAGSLADSLLAHNAALSISAPPNSFGRFFLGAGPGFNIVDALSEDILSEWPGLASEHCGKPGVIAVARNAGTGFAVAQQRLGSHRIAVGNTEIEYCALADLVGRFRSLSLLHFGSTDGHCGLLLSVLPQLAASRPLVWLELPARGSVAQVEDVCDAFSAAKYEIFGIKRAHVMENGAMDKGFDVDAVSRSDGEEIAVLLLVPHGHSTGRGFGLLAKAATEDSIRDALLTISTDAKVSSSGMHEASPIEIRLP